MVNGDALFDCLCVVRKCVCLKTELKLKNERRIRKKEKEKEIQMLHQKKL